MPYPDKETFWQLVKLGGELRQIHLLESPVVENPITRYPQDGDSIICRKSNKTDFELTHWITKQVVCGLMISNILLLFR